MRRAGLGLAVALLLHPAPTAAQDLRFTGYALNVLAGNAEGPYTDAAVQDVQRLRLMVAPATGPVQLDLAYEQVLTLATLDLDTDLGAGMLLGSPSRGDWLPLQGTIASGPHASWRHRLDRASLAVEAGTFTGSLGRQTVSWGTTLFLTPADPFAPFDPADPFRDYRLGVDAARARFFPSAFAEIEAVVRPASYDDSTVVTALGRGHVGIGRTDLAGWGGMLHGAAAGAMGITTILLDAALRGELVVRDDTGRVVVRWAAGVDRSFTLADRMLYAVIEYQYDGFGAASGAELGSVLLSATYRRGEMQVLGRHELATQATYDLHPLIQVGALALWNIGDGSVLLTPSLNWNAGRDLTIRGGAFAGLGADQLASGLPASEYGAVPFSGYLSGTLFF